MLFWNDDYINGNDRRKQERLNHIWTMDYVCKLKKMEYICKEKNDNWFFNDNFWGTIFYLEVNCSKFFLYFIKT